MKRKYLVSQLLKLSSDELTYKEIMYMTKKDLIQAIIECAHYHKEFTDNV